MSNCFRIVPLFALRAAAAAVGFNPEGNNLDKIIGDNVRHHKGNAADTRLNMSAAVVDRVVELTDADAGPVSAETNPSHTTTPNGLIPGATEQTTGATTEPTATPADLVPGPPGPSDLVEPSAEAGAIPPA